MKKFIFLSSIAIIPLAAASFFAVDRPLRGQAEGSETPETSVVSSDEQTADSSSEGEKKFDVENVTIDGKTIAQWKEELKNENTRMAAIFSIAFITANGVLFALKWLNERGILKRADNNSKLTSEQIEVTKQALDKFFDETSKEVTERINKAAQEMEALQAKQEQYDEEYRAIIAMFEAIMKTDPNLVARDTYLNYKKNLDELRGKYVKKD